jgi:hydroxymethylpyrimidine/phosphomethylpyrimidine kinase
MGLTVITAITAQKYALVLKKAGSAFLPPWWRPQIDAVLQDFSRICCEDRGCWENAEIVEVVAGQN